MDSKKVRSPSPQRSLFKTSSLAVPSTTPTKQRAHSQPNIREGLANLNEQLCAAMIGVVLGGGAGGAGAGGAEMAKPKANRASSASPSVVSQLSGSLLS